MRTEASVDDLQHLSQCSAIIGLRSQFVVGGFSSHVPAPECRLIYVTFAADTFFTRWG